MKNKSAKDLAFERERVKFRKHINDLEACIVERDSKIIELTIRNTQLEGERDQLQDWVNRLLEYMEMSKEDLDTIIRESKHREMLLDHVKFFFSNMGRY